MKTSTTLTEGSRSYEFLLSEASGRLSRDEVMVAQDSQVYSAGTVLKEDAGKMVRFDGTGSAVGILCHEIEAVVGDEPAAAVTRLAEVDRAELVFADGVTEAQIDAAVETLAAAFIIVR